METKLSKRVRLRTRDVSYLFRMPSGIPGDINRVNANPTVETAQIAAAADTHNPTTYGVALVIDATSGKARLPTTGDVAGSIYGFFARPYPTSSSQDPLGTSTPPDGGMGDVLRRGYMTVKLNGATAAKKGGQVFIRIDVGSGSVIGGVEAASDTTHTVSPPATFMGPADSDGNVEIAFNI